MVIPVSSPAVEMRKSLWRETTIEIISFPFFKQWYPIHTWSDGAFKGTVVNRTLQSHETMPTVPLL